MLKSRSSKTLWTLAALWLLTGALAGASGCTAVRTTDPARTATEQFLLSGAASLAIEQLNVEPLRGRSVYIGATYLNVPEKEFVLGELRAHLLLSGVQLVNVQEDAQVILELRSGGLGIDRYEFLLGVPSLLIPQGTQPGQATPILTPELSVVKNLRQTAFASIAFVAYWRDTSELISASGPHIGVTYRKDWWFFGAGPRTFGNIAPTEPGAAR